MSTSVFLSASYYHFSIFTHSLTTDAIKYYQLTASLNNTHNIPLTQIATLCLQSTLQYTEFKNEYTSNSHSIGGAQKDSMHQPLQYWQWKNIYLFIFPGIMNHYVLFFFNFYEDTVNIVNITIVVNLTRLLILYVSKEQLNVMCSVLHCETLTLWDGAHAKSLPTE